MKLFNIESPTQKFIQGANTWAALLKEIEKMTEGALLSVFGPPYGNCKIWYLTASPVKGGAEKKIEVRVDGLGWTEANLIK
jgi:hypothetical protein